MQRQEDSHSKRSKPTLRMWSHQDSRARNVSAIETKENELSSFFVSNLLQSVGGPLTL